jgi:hypothetical protein
VVHNENITCAQILDNVAYVPMLNFILIVNEQPSRVARLKRRLSNELFWQYVINV